MDQPFARNMDAIREALEAPPAEAPSRLRSDLVRRKFQKINRRFKRAWKEVRGERPR